MVTERTTHRLVAITGLAAGLALALILVLSWRVPESTGRLGADARLVAVPPGELELSKTGAFLSARGLAPGHSARGGVQLKNITNKPVEVLFRGLASNQDLDRLLNFELRADGRRLASGPLGRLRRRFGGLRIPSGEGRALEARLWLPRSAPSGWQARSTEVTFELGARILRRPR